MATAVAIALVIASRRAPTRATVRTNSWTVPAITRTCTIYKDARSPTGWLAQTHRRLTTVPSSSASPPITTQVASASGQSVGLVVPLVTTGRTADAPTPKTKSPVDGCPSSESAPQVTWYVPAASLGSWTDTAVWSADRWSAPVLITRPPLVWIDTRLPARTTGSLKSSWSTWGLIKTRCPAAGELLTKKA